MSNVDQLKLSSTQELQASGKVGEAPPWVAEVTVMWMLKPELTGILDLTERQLEHMPEPAFRMKRLRSVLVPQNFITAVRRTLAESDVEKIILSHNKVETFESEVLRKWPQLKELRLDHNQLDHVPDFSDALKLKVLDLSHNPIASFPSHRFTALSLTTLRLDDIDLSTATAHFSRSIYELRFLEHLHLAKCKLPTLPEGITTLRSLVELDLRQNALKSLPAELGQLERISVLSVQRNRLCCLPSELGLLVNLVSFRIAGNPYKKDPQLLALLEQFAAADASTANEETSSAAAVAKKKKSKKKAKKKNSQSAKGKREHKGKEEQEDQDPAESADAPVSVGAAEEDAFAAGSVSERARAAVCPEDVVAPTSAAPHDSAAVSSDATVSDSARKEAVAVAEIASVNAGGEGTSATAESDTEAGTAPPPKRTREKKRTGKRSELQQDHDGVLSVAALRALLLHLRRQLRSRLDGRLLLMREHESPWNVSHEVQQQATQGTARNGNNMVSFEMLTTDSTVVACSPERLLGYTTQMRPDRALVRLFLLSWDYYLKATDVLELVTVRMRAVADEPDADKSVKKVNNILRLRTFDLLRKWLEMWHADLVTDQQQWPRVHALLSSLLSELEEMGIKNADSLQRYLESGAGEEGAESSTSPERKGSKLKRAFAKKGSKIKLGLGGLGGGSSSSSSSTASVSGAASSAGEEDGEATSSSKKSGKSAFPRLAISNRTYELLYLDPADVARQLTLIEARLFRAVPVLELLHQKWTGKRGGAPALLEAIAQFNRVSGWVQTEIIKERDLHRRTKLLDLIIRIAYQCNELHNYNCAFAIMSALGGAAISRLKHTWRLLSEKTNGLADRLNLLIDGSGNFREYRRLLASMSEGTFLVPYLGLFLSDLTFIEDGNPSWVTDSDLINFHKFLLLGEQFRRFETYQSTSYKKLGSINKDLASYLLHCEVYDENRIYAESMICEPRNSDAKAQPSPPAEVSEETLQASTSTEFLKAPRGYRRSVQISQETSDEALEESTRTRSGSTPTSFSPRRKASTFSALKSRLSSRFVGGPLSESEAPAFPGIRVRQQSDFAKLHAERTPASSTQEGTDSDVTILSTDTPTLEADRSADASVDQPTNAVVSAAGDTT